MTEQNNTKQSIQSDIGSKNQNSKKLEELKERIKNLKEKLEESTKKIENLTESAKRAIADLQNYKRRIEEEKKSFIKFAHADVFLEILPIYDSFERANEHLPKELLKNDWVKGIQNIIKQFEQIMEKFNVKKMETIGKKFDPNKHEAVAECAGEKDIIVEELEAGYLIEDRVLRPAKVKVGNGQKT
jgi:molecular chaperone GrpE